MNTLVTIQQKTHPRDDLLNKPEKWDEFAKAWCKPTIAGGGETQPNRQTIATNNWTLETHWSEKLAGVMAKMRVLLPDGRLLGIKSVVNENMANRKLVITCEETS